MSKYIPSFFFKNFKKFTENASYTKFLPQYKKVGEKFASGGSYCGDVHVINTHGAPTMTL